MQPFFTNLHHQPKQYTSRRQWECVHRFNILARLVSVVLLTSHAPKQSIDPSIYVYSLKGDLITAIAAELCFFSHCFAFTVFAPTDAAFAKIPKADLDALLKDKAKLTAVLTYHVVAGKVMAADVKAGKVKTVQGSELTVSTTGGVMVDKAKVTATDIVADNGVIHVIDSVIMPK